jgi:hypothetical protein
MAYNAADLDPVNFSDETFVSFVSLNSASEALSGEHAVESA